MTELENRICELLQGFVPCTCAIGTCEGEHVSKSCKVVIARQIIALVLSSAKDDCERCETDYASHHCLLCDRYPCVRPKEE